MPLLRKPKNLQKGDMLALLTFRHHNIGVCLEQGGPSFRLSGVCELVLATYEKSYITDIYYYATPKWGCEFQLNGAVPSDFLAFECVDVYDPYTYVKPELNPHHRIMGILCGREPETMYEATRILRKLIATYHTSMHDEMHYYWYRDYLEFEDNEHL